MSDAQKKLKSSPSYINPNLGRKATATSRKNMSDAQKGIKHSIERRERRKSLNLKQSPETIEKRSKAMKGKKQKLLTCPHCDKSGGTAAMKRWHFDNCPEYKISTDSSKLNT